MTKTTINNFTNEQIEFDKAQARKAFERIKVSMESYDFHHKKFMKEPTTENRLNALQSFEHYSYDMSALSMHQHRELEERLRVANMLLQENGIEVPEGKTSIIDRV